MTPYAYPPQYPHPQYPAAGYPYQYQAGMQAVPASPQQTATPHAPLPQQPQEPQQAQQSEQQKLVTRTLAGLAMRDLTLVDSIMDYIEELEGDSEDPELLEKLFKIDNLATRMRRNGENLLVLAGEDSGDSSGEPVPLLDIARAAISEISEYQRVQVGDLPEFSLTGSAADDLTHLLAELMDNATEKSSEHAQVVVSAQSMADSRLLVTVEDEGIGIPDEQLTELNSRLAGEPVLDEQVMRRMGLYVVSRIAHRHDMQVQLEARAFRGVSAHVIVPARLFAASSQDRSQRRAGGSDSGASTGSFTRVSSASEPGRSEPDSTESTGSSRRREQSPGPAQNGSGPNHPQEKNSAMDSSVTAAGLPRRSAHKSSALPPMPPADESSTAETGAGEGNSAAQETSEAAEGDRAERIRADLEGFIEGQQAAGSDE